MIGSLQAALWVLLTDNNWEKTSAALLVLALGLLLSGGLHHDGLIDVADGLGASEGKKLEAMADSRVGAFGVIAILILTLIEISALINLDQKSPLVLIVAGFCGRISPILAISRFEYLRPKGSASFHRQYSKKWCDLLPSVIFSPLIVILSGTFVLILGIVIAALTAEFIGVKLGGHTGDSYGACVVITECLILLIASVS